MRNIKPQLCPTQKRAVPKERLDKFRNCFVKTFEKCVYYFEFFERKMSHFAQTTNIIENFVVLPVLPLVRNEKAPCREGAKTENDGCFQLLFLIIFAVVCRFAVVARRNRYLRQFAAACAILQFVMFARTHVAQDCLLIFHCYLLFCKRSCTTSFAVLPLQYTLPTTSPKKRHRKLGRQPPQAIFVLATQEHAHKTTVVRQQGYCNAFNGKKAVARKFFNIFKQKV